MVDISNSQAIIIEVCAMFFGYGIRLKGYKISGDVAIAIGIIGIFMTCFYDGICLLITKYLWMQWIFIILTILFGINLYLLIRKKSLFSKREILFSQNLFNSHKWVDVNGGSVIHFDDIAYSLNSSLAKISGHYLDGAEKELKKKIKRNIVFSGQVYRPSKWINNVSTDRLSIEDSNNNGYGFCIYHSLNVADIEIIKDGKTIKCSEQKAFNAPKDQWYNFVLSIFKDGIIRLNIYNFYGNEIFSISYNNKDFKNFDRIVARGEAPFYIDELKIETL